MKPFARRTLVFGALVVAASVAARFGRQGWFEALVNERMFSEPTVWFDTPELILWCFDLLFFFALGMLVAGIFRSHAPRLWAVAFGAICGILHFVGARDYVVPDAPWFAYVWLYGVYVMPVLGAFLGALASQLAPNYSFNATVACRGENPAPGAAR